MFVTTVGASKRKITITISGYVSDTFDPADLPTGFTFKGNFYIISNISYPKSKGVFSEVALEGVHHFYITS